MTSCLRICSDISGAVGFTLACDIRWRCLLLIIRLMEPLVLRSARSSSGSVVASLCEPARCVRSLSLCNWLFWAPTSLIMNPSLFFWEMFGAERSFYAVSKVVWSSFKVKNFKKLLSLTLDLKNVVATGYCWALSITWKHMILNHNIWWFNNTQFTRCNVLLVGDYLILTGFYSCYY